MTTVHFIGSVYITILISFLVILSGFRKISVNFCQLSVNRRFVVSRSLFLRVYVKNLAKKKDFQKVCGQLVMFRN